MRALAFLFGGAMLAAQAVPNQELSTYPYRVEHAGIAEELGHVGAWAEALPTSNRADQRKYMTWIVVFLDEHVASHVAFEEKKVYPAVERRTEATAPPVTESFRAEHRVVARWMAELAAIRREKNPDVRLFARRTHNLIGLLQAHFETEEEILLPLLDPAMTPEEYKREIGHGTHGGPT